MRLTTTLAAVIVSGLVFSTHGWAQSTTAGTIAGNVKDTTGAVLPGVTVEAASPALIEKTRSVVTDGQGNYRILELRPGTYSVTFTLPGFGTFKREGLELATGFTTTVNAEMKVGAVEETVTVTGASPVVDVQNVRTQQVLTREVWDAIPTGKTLSSYVQLTLGATMGANGQDVGGTKGDKSGGGASFEYHGAGQNDQAIVIDGMRVNAPTTGGGPWTRTTVNNERAIEETTIGSGISAENENAGVVINLIPREGGNTFSGQFALNGSAARFQSDNLTPELIARNVPVQGALKKLYDVSGSGGGPIKKDRLWFYYSDKWWNASNIIPGGFFNASKVMYGSLATYAPDLSRPAVGEAPNHNDSGRVTWQLNRAHKISSFIEAESQCNCYFSAGASRAPEAALHLDSPYGSKFLIQESWTWVKGNRWLFSAGNSTYYSISKGSPGRVKETSLTAVPMQDLNTGFFWNAPGDDDFPQGPCCTPMPDGKIVGAGWAHDQNYSATHTTGSHTLKVGFRMYENGGKGSSSSYNDTPLGPVKVQVRGGVCLTAGCTPPAPVPAAVLLLINPRSPAYVDRERGGSLQVQTALYAQDQLTVKRLTLNLGLRMDTYHGKFYPSTVAANNYAPQYSFPGLDNSPNWKDINPRVGAAYDLFGNGRTAVKGSIGRFVVHQTGAGSSPAGATSGLGQGNRTWNDSFYPVGDPRRGNFVPDCDLKNPVANGECGLLPNPSRGIPSAPTTFYDSAYLVGWHVRPYLWNTSVSVQHELALGFGLNVGYFRTINSNQTATDNRAVTPADYNTYCVTAPVDDRLGSVSGSRLCGLSDLTVAARSRAPNNFVTLAENLGVNPRDVGNFIDVGINAKFGRGGVLSGGVSTSNTVNDTCFTIDAPYRDGYCRTVSDWQQGAQVKLHGNYPLPWWGVGVSATFQNLPGPGVGANRSYANAEIQPSLGRALSAGSTANVSISMLPPNTRFEDRFSQTDLRLTKRLQVQRLRVQGQFDIYNLFNSSAVLAASSTYGSSWLRPSSILGARLIKFGVQMDWK